MSVEKKFFKNGVTVRLMMTIEQKDLLNQVLVGNWCIVHCFTG